MPYDMWDSGKCKIIRPEIINDWYKLGWGEETYHKGNFQATLKSTLLCASYPSINPEMKSKMLC